jgi:hypothetical protein
MATKGGIGCGLVAFMKDDCMNDSRAGTGVEKPPSPVTTLAVTTLPPDVMRLLDVFARIELRRQARLRAERLREAS